MPDTDRSVALREARAQRADLWRQLVSLEEALATPVPGRVDAWAADVHEAVVELAATLERHVAVTEGPGGLFAEVLESAPRLAGAVDSLRAEHGEFSATLAAELRALRAVDGANSLDDVAEVRQRLTDLLRGLFRHRQAGSDLVYEAYAVDIGVGD